jgi:hypothetical protein
LIGPLAESFRARLDVLDIALAEKRAKEKAAKED